MRVLLYREAAVRDVSDAYDWYEAQRPGLGEEFLTALGDVQSAICSQPHRFPIILRRTRRALLKRFPYGVYFRAEGEALIVVSCYHTSRSPQQLWRRR